jgi:beta-phosphoglucomutase-like phosphatase (HAD superfamily)
VTAIQLVVLDMAGTTVADDGLVEQAFSTAIGAQGIESGTPEYGKMLDHVRATMGESKITVFRHLLDNDETKAQQANKAFETAYGVLVDEGRCAPIPGESLPDHRIRRDHSAADPRSARLAEPR